MSLKLAPFNFPFFTGFEFEGSKSLSLELSFKLTEILENIPHPLNEDLAKSYGFSNVEELKESFYQILQKKSLFQS